MQLEPDEAVGSLPESSPGPTAVYVPPPAYAPVPIAPPPKRRGRGTTALVVGLIVLVILLAAGGGTVAYGNFVLAPQYSPQRAVTDYFAAQVSGNATGMLDNATFLKGDGAISRFFDQAAVKAMLAVGPNRQVAGVKVVSVDRIDDATSHVTVSMSWNGTSRTHVYTVAKDLGRVHDYFYYSWGVQIPYVSIHVTLPKQPGFVFVDDVEAPADATTVQAIEGYHTVGMSGTDLYDQAANTVAGFDGDVQVSFDGKLNSLAVQSAQAAIKRVFATCPATGECLGKTYYVQPKPGYIVTEVFRGLPGYSELDASTSWKWSLSGDPTTGMKLVVTNDNGVVDASGTCGFTFTLDGRRNYRFKGTWTATLMWQTSGFVADLNWGCVQAKA